MALVKDDIEGGGGSIEVTSEDGKVAHFLLILPLVKVQSGPALAVVPIETVAV